MIHKNRATKNHPFTAFRASLIFPLKTNFNVFKLKPYNESINLSYIHVIKAIVHPLTHGITSQVHIKTHFTKTIILSKYFFITKNKKIKQNRKY
jgi:hypothetical protein